MQKGLGKSVLVNSCGKGKENDVSLTVLSDEGIVIPWVVGAMQQLVSSHELGIIFIANQKLRWLPTVRNFVMHDPYTSR